MNLDALKGIKALVTDVDGVLTDGGLWVDAEGRVTKRFFVRDGSGMVRLQRAGMPVCWLTGRSDSAVTARAKELRITRVVAGSHDKADALHSIALGLGVEVGEIAYIGDDLLDLPAIALAGISFAPQDAADEVLAAVDVVVPLAGGQGVVRWVCDRLMSAQPESL